VDIHALKPKSHGIDLPTALAAAKGIDTSGTLDRIPLAMQRDLTRLAQAVDLGMLPVLRSDGA
jgi:hypothetical protein